MDQNEFAVDEALNALEQKLYHLHAVRWYKKHYGFFEKPSVLKRKRKRMKKILSQRHTQFMLTGYDIRYGEMPPNLWLKRDFRAQFMTSGCNAVGQ